MDIGKLPDLPSLEQLANSLWRKGSARGAAVLVGSGFSRNADRAGADTPKPPLWRQLYNAMAERLYATDPKNAPSDALRLAEEFKCYLGRAALDEFLRQHVRDEAWRPGKLHIALMALPWSDVLTTNWDTLLERASNAYRVVRNPADIPRMPAPRVVKLHGSIDTNGILVFAEEDYRNYPARSAAFVNLARQVFLENELCLIGFSGDDPNFLQWSGWVRDHLGDSARRIYLVGSLNLSPAKRKLLESRNVAPIDFAPITTDLECDEDGRARQAMEVFLKFLNEARPKQRHDWTPRSTMDFRVGLMGLPDRPVLSDAEKEAKLDEIMAIWQTDREGYPSWLICPSRERTGLWCESALTTSIWSLLASKRPEIRALCLYELAWRYQHALCALQDDIIEKLRAIADPLQPCGLGRDRQLEVAVLLLREARISRNLLAFRRIEMVLARETAPGTDRYADLVYQRLLWSRDELDYQALSSGLKDLDGDDPVWKLRRAALHWECGEPDDAKLCLQAAITDLDERQRHDPSSIWAASRRSWAAVIARVARISELFRFERDDRPGKIIKIGCDPDDELDKLRREVEEKLRKLLETRPDFEPSFGAGCYKDNTSTIIISGRAGAGPTETIDRLADIAGIPMRMPHVDILASMSVDAAESSFEPTLVWHLRLLRSIHHSADRVFERRFSRMAVARLDPIVATALIKSVFAAVHYWRDRSGRNDPSSMYALDRLRLFVEALSRLVPCSNDETMRSAFKLAAELAPKTISRDPWMTEPLANLAEHSLCSLRREERVSLVLDCLQFPLPDENPWSTRGPNPSSYLFADGIIPQRPPDDPRWKMQINTLIEQSKAGAARNQAVERLAYLCHYGALEKDENETFGVALWSKTDAGRCGFPSDIELFPHVIIGLPAPEGIEPIQIARALLYDAPLQGSDLTTRLPAIVAASLCRPPFTRLQATREDAVRIMDEFISLDLQMDSTHPIRREIMRGVVDQIGQVMAYAILPNLDAGDLTEGRLQFVFAMSESERGRGVLAGLPWLIAAGSDLPNKVATRLRRAISRGSLLDIQAAARAIESWANRVSKTSNIAVPESILSSLVATIEASRLTGLQPLIWCIRSLFTAGLLSTDHMATIRTALGDLIKDLSYEAMPVGGAEAIGLTTARAECVRLSHILIEAGQGNESARAWIELSATDPLPEVRSAIQTM